MKVPGILQSVTERVNRSSLVHHRRRHSATGPSSALRSGHLPPRSQPRSRQS